MVFPLLQGVFVQMGGEGCLFGFVVCFEILEGILMGIIFMVRADYQCSKEEAIFLSLTLGPGGPMSPAGPLGPGIPSAPRTPLLPFMLRVERPGRPGKPGAPVQKHQSK